MYSSGDMGLVILWMADLGSSDFSIGDGFLLQEDAALGHLVLL